MALKITLMRKLFYTSACGIKDCIVVTWRVFYELVEKKGKSKFIANDLKKIFSSKLQVPVY